MNFLIQNFESIAALVAFVLIVSEWIDKAWNLDGTASQIRSFIIALLASTAGSYFNVGLFAAPETGTFGWYYEGPIVGAYVGIICNWAFLTPAAKSILELIRVRPKEKAGG